MITKELPPEGCRLVAVIDGSGSTSTVGLYVEDSGGETVAMLKWPDSWPRTASSEFLRQSGFDVYTA